MQVTEKMIRLISDIEEKIGGSCFNGDSYNGWNGEYGCDFRYPIVYETKHDGGHLRHKTKNTIYDAKDIDAENIMTVCYKFGANELSIGKAIIDILNMLEIRFGLDIESLESRYQDMRKTLKEKILQARYGGKLEITDYEEKYLMSIGAIHSEDE